MKFALITGSALISVAIVFAMMPAPAPQAPPPVPQAPPPVNEAVSDSLRLDSLYRASQAPPPPAPDYTPTWVSTGGGTEPPSTKQGGRAKFIGDVDSIDFAPAVAAQEETSPVHHDETPPPHAPEPTSVAPPASDRERANPNPNNNTELREWLRKGK